MTKKQLITKLHRKTMASPCRFKVGVICYDKRGHLLGIAYNTPRFSRKGGGLHAEMMALQKWGVRIHSMTLLRFSKSGKLLPIHPCKNCRKVLTKLGIRVTV